MAYEYERINNIGCVTSPISTDQAVEELQEVYRKAKAFDHIKVIYDKNMNEMSISDAECIEMIGNELEDK